MPLAVLPSSLARAVAAETSRLPLGDLVHAAQSLSLSYRHQGGTIPQALSEPSRAAYLAVRLPATHAAISAAFSETSRTIDGATLRTCLDIGAGPGTATFAAHGTWPTITAFQQLERDRGWATIAARLAQSLGINAASVAADVASAHVAPHDLVVAGYALNELTKDRLDAAVKRLWAATTVVLVVVEPGTPAGFAVVRRVRELCLELGGHAAAPCTHNDQCPMSIDDWCHRAVRTERNSLHRQLKDAQLGFEDEKFSFVAITRAPPLRLAPSRIIRRPIRAGGHVHLDLCTNGEVVRATVTRADRTSYKAARDAQWGELWPQEAEPRRS
jgi:ribosomal protein RSM22 (predicted rRNA methylase)